MSVPETALEEQSATCDREHVRPDMGKRMVLIFIAGVAIGVILASVALGLTVFA